VTVKSIAELLAQADASFPDNTTGFITPGALRTFVKDFLDSIAPAYGAMQLTTAVDIVATTTPQVIAPYDSVIAATAGFYTPNLVAGTITRTLNGVAGSTSLFTVSGFLSGPNNADAIIRLYKNGAPTPFFVGASSSGAANTTAFNLAGFDYTTVDAVYDLRVSTPSGTPTFTIDELSIIIQMNPVRSFT
jgi:hypothetical protein